ncbi:uncharacterized protein LOC144648145 [Oculina patagonica]
MAQIIPFQLEPEYSSDEERPKSIVEEEEEVLFPELGNLRLGNSLWCICTNCSEMPSEKECVCCKEMKNIYLMMEGLHCVTQHENFSAVCLNRDVLWTALAKPDGVYVGYKEGDDDDDENHDSEIQQAWRDFIHLCEV